MKNKHNWKMMMALILVACSIAFYCLHYYFFHDLHHIFLYLVGDIAFLFLDVLIVTLVLHQLLAYRDKQVVVKKLNMVIGTFFSEVGTDLLKHCTRFDPKLSAMDCKLVVATNWQDKDFLAAKKSVEQYDFIIDSKQPKIEELKDFLVAKRQFLLALLENPNLLEHEAFTELLWAVFHLADELAHRKSFVLLPEADYQHLSGDIRRVYKQLILQWLDYMRYLKHDYPYLFSLALRMNPFDAKACIEVKG